MADYAGDIIESLVGVSFNRKLMRLGSKMPDIQPLRRIQIHSPQIILPHFKKEYNRIVLQEKNINRISFILGILSHYIADAFCYSHNKYVVDMKKHIKYEYYLDREKCNIKISQNINNMVIDYLKSIKKGIDSIDKYIKKTNNEYIFKVKKLSWEEIIRIDLENAIVHSAALLTYFIMELQEVRVPAVCLV
ncbi:zinc dependent phospholipase C family protein [Defluviitalea phaphyphila]|uniref:zinc dependent phospholipase C family protein n=1 Tax=Defluviitalea phaphyphila TaxID=1473580 RepID=UPI001A9A4515|nr:zinc dependent phospholipase C family protein [Defluviitalea phaphyphila]